MIKKLSFFTLLVIFALVLSACQSAQRATATTTGSTARGSATRQAGGFPPGGAGASSATATLKGADATPAASATPALTITSTPTALPVTAAAEAMAQAYFNALQKKDFTTAANSVSIFSLSYAGLTRTQAASQLQALSIAGSSWSDFKIVGSQVFNDTTLLVHVTYKLSSNTTPTPTLKGADATPSAQGAASITSADSSLKDELWPFRQENGAWLYNWNNLIDLKTVESTPQTNFHITIKPMLFARYSDRLELHFMMQNQTSDVVYLVQTYDSLAQFHFGEQVVEADKSRSVVVSGLRTSFDEVIQIKGLYTSFPSWVEIKKYKGYAPNPWFSFQF